MKKHILLAFFSFLSCSSFSQKEDHIWAFGYDSNTYPQHPGTERITFDFNDSLKITYSQGGISFLNSSASICDPSGNLILLSNSCYIETGAGAFVQGSSGLNPGYMYNEFCANGGNGYNVPQNMLLLRDPSNSNLVHLFHIRLTLTTQVAFLDDLLHTLVDISANNGNGKALFKNQPVVNDSIDSEGIHAVRHANGRDWWIVVGKYLTNTYHILLLSPQGIEAKTQSIGPYPQTLGGNGEMVFSPDGTKLARFNTKDDLRILDFDRCSGTFSNYRHVPVQDNADNQIFGGLAWSADGHYLYAGEVKRLLQFDVLASDIAASTVIIAEAEPPLCPLSGTIGFLELGPDGMIYGTPLNGQKCMHRIKHPERASTASELQQNFYQLEFSFSNFPHFPNFRLGPVDGSVCDTLGINNLPLAGWRYERTGGNAVDFVSVSWYEPTAWLWDFGDGVQSSERNPSHSFPSAGAYEVCLEVSNQYGSDIKCKTVWVGSTATKEPPNPTDITFYPNPSSGSLYWTNTGAEPVLLRLYNPLGQLLLSQESADGFVSIAQFLPGIYTAQLVSNNGRVLTATQVVLK
jgi:hypothetical protein